jgi:hypothetical protein
VGRQHLAAHEGNLHHFAMLRGDALILIKHEVPQPIEVVPA